MTKGQKIKWYNNRLGEVMEKKNSPCSQISSIAQYLNEVLNMNSWKEPQTVETEEAKEGKRTRHIKEKAKILTLIKGKQLKTELQNAAWEFGFHQQTTVCF